MHAMLQKTKISFFTLELRYLMLKANYTFTVGTPVSVAIQVKVRLHPPVKIEVTPINIHHKKALQKGHHKHTMKNWSS